jgi:hypothetical protein
VGDAAGDVVVGSAATSAAGNGIAGDGSGRAVVAGSTTSGIATSTSSVVGSNVAMSTSTDGPSPSPSDTLGNHTVETLVVGESSAS